MDASSYYFRKNLITGSVLFFFVIVLMMLGSQMGYYQNAVQAQLSGINDIESAGGAGIQVFKNILINLLIFVPVIFMAVGGAYNSRFGRSIAFRFMLIAPVIIYGASVYLDWGEIMPFNEKFKDIYASMENIVFIPFILCYTVLALYMLAVIIKPSSMTTKVIGSITLVISICFYVIFGIFVMYLQGKSALDGTFGFNHFILYVICFGLDVTTYFLMLSLIMSFAAMHREDMLWERDKERRRGLRARRQAEEEPQEYYEDEPNYYAEDQEYEEYEDEYDYYGEYMVEDEDGADTDEARAESETEQATDDEAKTDAEESATERKRFPPPKSE